ncbi:MAG: tellurite resistance TerB family protein [Bauldia sp.]
MQPRRPVSLHEALIYAMVTLSAADRTMTERELRKIGDIVKTAPIFDDFDPERLVAVAQECGRLLQGPSSLDTILEVIAEAVPARLRDTTYALAVEVAAADDEVEREEGRFLHLLRRRLGLDQLTAAAIERSALARHRRL